MSERGDISPTKWSNCSYSRAKYVLESTKYKCLYIAFGGYATSYLSRLNFIVTSFISTDII